MNVDLVWVLYLLSAIFVGLGAFGVRLGRVSLPLLGACLFVLAFGVVKG